MASTVRPATLVVNEIYRSIQGESSWAGLPCVFVRLTACHLRCVWCDSTHTFHEGRRWPLEQVLERTDELAGAEALVEITGGEPLLQQGVYPLMRELLRRGRTVLLETSGAVDISAVPEGVARIMDLKCPDSGESGRNLLSNLELLRPPDELKFVVASRTDYEWARDMLRRHDLARRCTVLMGTVFDRLEPRRLVEWILEDRLPVRFQLQMHKYVWSPDRRGV
jgi:7-carboxy-7-deazaguanine synthase